MRSVEPPPEALQTLYREAYRPLVAALRLATGHKDDAEEIAQESFARLVSEWDRVSEFDDPAAWVRKVAFRLVIDRRRRLLRVARRWITWPADPAHDHDKNMDVRHAIVQLPTAQRQVVVLHYLYDLRIEDVASILGVEPGTVKSRLSRARTALAVTLREEVSYD